jgi:hypothetical protein
MEWQALSYREYLKLPLDKTAELKEVRRFGNCIVLAAWLNGQPALILEEPWQRATVCRYDDVEERTEDIRYLLSNGGPLGGEEADCPVRPPSGPPLRSLADAIPMPFDGDSET